MALCVSLSATTFEETSQLLASLIPQSEAGTQQKGPMIVEVRADLMSNRGKGEMSDDELHQIFRYPNLPKIATCRDLKSPGFTAERRQVLEKAMESGASYVDVEYEAPEDYQKAVVSVAKKFNVDVIISYHNYESTPSSTELETIVNRCYACGADIAKVATMAKSKQDSARVLALYNSEKPVVALAMGGLGQITRVAAVKLGAPFTFVSASAEAATAPGAAGCWPNADYFENYERLKSLHQGHVLTT